MTTAQKLPSMAQSLHKQLHVFNNEITIDQISEALRASFSNIDLDDYERIKQANGIFHKAIKELGADIKRTVLLNLVSKSLGTQNHHVLKAKNVADIQKVNRDNWYDFKVGRFTVIVGRSGTGKSILLEQEAQSLDSYDTLLLDYGNSHSLGTIEDYNKRMGTNLIGFKKSVYVDLEKKGSVIPTKRYKRIIIDEPFLAEYRHPIKKYVFLNAKNSHLILLLQAESDMFEFGINPTHAERFYDNMGPRVGFDRLIKIYQFDYKAAMKKRSPVERIKAAVHQDYVDDAIMVFHKSQSVDFTLKVSEVAEHLEREPSIISRSKNFNKVYDFYINSMDRNSDRTKSQMIRDINAGLNRE